jgi:ribosomal protein S5
MRRRTRTPSRKPSTRQKVSFIATRKVAKLSRVSFTTRAGKKVRFTATKKGSRPVRVTFYKSKSK